jgi:hypothetical protein
VAGIDQKRSRFARLFFSFGELNASWRVAPSVRLSVFAILPARVFFRAKRFCHPKKREKYRRNAVAFYNSHFKRRSVAPKRANSDTKAMLYLVGNAAEAFGLRSMCGQRFGGESHEKRHRSSSA